MGALTSKPQAFIMRSWESKKGSSIDLMDAWGYNIIFEYRGTEILRILPDIGKTNENEWIPDITRYMYSGLYKDRSRFPLLKKRGKKDTIISWSTAFTLIKQHLCLTNQMRGLIGITVDIESTILLKRLLEILGSYGLYNNTNFNMDNDFRLNYMFKDKLNINSNKLIINLGLNMRMEAPLLYAQLKLDTIISILNFSNLNSKLEIGYNILHFINGQHMVCQFLTKISIINIISGDKLYYYQLNFINKLLMMNLKYISKVSNCIIDVHHVLNYASQAHTYEIGIERNNKLFKYSNSSIISLASDENNYDVYSNFNIYIGFRKNAEIGCVGIHLPSPTYTETTGTFINTSGKIQLATSLFEKVNFTFEMVRIIWFLLYLQKKETQLNLKENIYIPTSTKYFINDNLLISVYNVRLSSSLVSKVYENLLVDPFFVNNFSRSSKLFALASRYNRNLEHIFQ